MSFPFSPPLSSDTAFEALAERLEDPRPHPPQEALAQLGHAVMNEVLDLFSDTALEDFLGVVCETLIGGFHAAAQRIEREADHARGDLERLVRDFGASNTGSEVEDGNLQDATRKTHAADIAVLALEAVRDAAAELYGQATGEHWKPWRGGVKPSRVTAGVIEAREALRAMAAVRHQSAHPGAAVVAFRAAPQADTQIDANRIHDALNWARRTWPDMCLATTGARGAETLAMKWAQAQRVRLVLAKPDFDRHGRRAIFEANDAMLKLKPVCVLTLANSLDAGRGSTMKDFGPALNLGQKASAAGLYHQVIRTRG